MTVATNLNSVHHHESWSFQSRGPQSELQMTTQRLKKSWLQSTWCECGRVGSYSSTLSSSSSSPRAVPVLDQSWTGGAVEMNHLKLNKSCSLQWRGSPLRRAWQGGVSKLRPSVYLFFSAQSKAAKVSLCCVYLFLKPSAACEVLTKFERLAVERYHRIERGVL